MEKIRNFAPALRNNWTYVLLLYYYNVQERREQVV